MKKTLVLGLMVASLFLIGAKGCSLEKSCYVNNIDTFVKCEYEYLECVSWHPEHDVCFDEMKECRLERRMSDCIKDFFQCLAPCPSELAKCYDCYANRIRDCSPVGGCLDDYAYCRSGNYAGCVDDLDSCADWFDMDCESSCYEDIYSSDWLGYLDGLDKYGECLHACYQ